MRGAVGSGVWVIRLTNFLRAIGSDGRCATGIRPCGRVISSPNPCGSIRSIGGRTGAIVAAVPRVVSVVAGAPVHHSAAVPVAVPVAVTPWGTAGGEAHGDTHSKGKESCRHHGRGAVPWRHIRRAI